VRLLMLATVSVCGAAASAQITSVGPFTGPHTEGFEAVIPNQLVECIPNRIFANTADLCDHETQTVVVPIGWSLFCFATPHSGQRFAVGIERPLEITFDAPVTGFGGYFATVGGQDGGTIEFFGASGPIGTATVTTNQCAYVWNGWRSATPFTRVRLIGNSSFSDGGYLHMDDLEYQAGGGACYPNCDGSTAAPVLNVADFTCFLQRFASGDAYANCDGSTASPALNVADFTCFLQRFAAGCQ
jgi:hypothetical protein